MRHIRSIIRVGNSLGVTLPRGLVAEHHLSPGDLLVFENDRQGKLTCRKLEPKTDGNTKTRDTANGRR